MIFSSEKRIEKLQKSSGGASVFACASLSLYNCPRTMIMILLLFHKTGQRERERVIAGGAKA